MLEFLFRNQNSVPLEMPWAERCRRIKQLREGYDAPITAEIERLIAELEERVERENS